jgi:hypothetical protein
MVLFLANPSSCGAASCFARCRDKVHRLRASSSSLFQVIIDFNELHAAWLEMLFRQDIRPGTRITSP